MIFKTKTRNTFFKGGFSLRNKELNWAHPIEFPTVFVAFGRDIKSGNWDSCTSINTPKYVIDNYFDGKTKDLHLFWHCVYALENITHEDVKNNLQMVLTLIDNANNELSKLPTL